MAWATVDDVAVALGLPVGDPGSDAFLVQSTDAANAWAYRERARNGYVATPATPTTPAVPEDPDVSPGPDVTMAVVLFAQSLYRARGALDSYPSFESFVLSQAPPAGSMGQINRLLGVRRVRVG